MSEKVSLISREFEVGYGRPPLHTRFKPGQSGNPKGRVKGRPSLTHAYRRLLAMSPEKFEAYEPKNGIEAIAKQTIIDAINGSPSVAVAAVKEITDRTEGKVKRR
jgi:hypothetical protein